MQKRCFVISPIGEPGSEVREHADDVLDFIIKPAMEELGIHAYRADHDQKIGRITDQMYRSILTDDLCVALLTFHNPNVFYELAIAQSAARPAIILIEKGQSIPFDIRDLRIIEYDLKPRALRDRVYVNMIIEHVRSLDAAQWKVDVPFGHQLSPLGGRSREFRLHDRVEAYGTTEDWMALLQDTVRLFDLSGVSLRWWTKIPGFGDALRKKAEAGCRVRIMIMDPENPALPKDANPGVYLVAEDIKGSAAFFGDLARRQPNISIRQIRTGILHQQIVRNDDGLVAALTLNGAGTSVAPMLEASAGTALHATLAGQFEVLWNTNPPG